MGPREHPLRRSRLVGPAEPDEVGAKHQAQVGGGEADGGVRRPGMSSLVMFI